MRSATLLAAYVFAGLAGYAAAMAHIPLAWMLGPLLAAACLSIAGIDLRPNVNLRKLGQLTIGAVAGLTMSAPVLAEMVRWLPLTVLSALFSVLVSSVLAAFLARHARIDQKTAFFASMPGGLAEMGNIGVRMGARPEPIAIVHTLRVALIVMTVPPVLIALGTPDPASRPEEAPLQIYVVAGLLLGGAGVAYLLRLARLNNPYMIGAVLFTGLFAGIGAVAGKIPQPAFSAAQLLIGFAIGCQFRRDMLARMPRVTLVGMVSILTLVLIMACFGMLLSRFTGFSYAVAVLATSPGGISEMVATAQILHLALPVVVCFQVVRGVLVNGLASYYFTILSRIGFLALLERLAGGPAPPGGDD